MKTQYGWLWLLIVIFLFPPVSGPAAELDCYTVIVGRDASDDGSVMLAHNEDDNGDLLFVNLIVRERRRNNPGDLVLLKNGASMAQVPESAAFLWLQIPGIDFADSYFNEHGVAVTSNACLSREDQPELVNGGIGFMLRRILAERATSARGAVELLGELVERFGYYHSGRTYAIADRREGWLVHVVKGKRWVAGRIPDSEVAVIANYYTLAGVDLDDRENYLGSPDIIDYAIRRGWYDPETEGAFDFARAYSDPRNLISEGNILRQWRGTNLLSRGGYQVEDRLPFSFQPRRKVKVSDLFNLMRDHYEGTLYDETDSYRKGSPNRTGKRTICTASTRYSFVAQLRSWLPPEMADLAWISFSRPDANAYAPWYLSLNEPPPGYTRGDPEKALADHFKAGTAFQPASDDLAFWSYQQLADLLDEKYRERIDKVQREWKNFENANFKAWRNREKEFSFLLQRQNQVARRIITNYVQMLELRRWFLTRELIRELKD